MDKVLDSTLVQVKEEQVVVIVREKFSLFIVVLHFLGGLFQTHDQFKENTVKVGGNVKFN